MTAFPSTDVYHANGRCERFPVAEELNQFSKCYFIVRYYYIGVFSKSEFSLPPVKPPNKPHRHVFVVQIHNTNGTRNYNLKVPHLPEPFVAAVFSAAAATSSPSDVSAAPTIPAAAAAVGYF